MHGSHHCMSLPRPWSQRHQQFFSNKVSFLHQHDVHSCSNYNFNWLFCIFVNSELLLFKGMYFFRASSPLAQLYSTSTMEHHHFDQCIMILNSQVTLIFLVGCVIVMFIIQYYIWNEKTFACRNSNHYFTILWKTFHYPELISILFSLTLVIKQF